MYKNILIAVIILVITGFVELVANGTVAEDFELTDSKGKTHKLSDYKGKWVVLEWTNFGCPFVKKHYDSDNMQKLQKEFTGKGVMWLSICSSGEGKQGYYDDMVELNKVISYYKCSHTAYLLDSDGRVGREFGARTTPQIVILNPDANIVYNGAIDDISTADKNDIPKAKNYISEVLKSVLSGKPSPFSTTKPYGCSVKYSEK